MEKHKKLEEEERKPNSKLRMILMENLLVIFMVISVIVGIVLGSSHFNSHTTLECNDFPVRTINVLPNICSAGYFITNNSTASLRNKSGFVLCNKREPISSVLYCPIPPYTHTSQRNYCYSLTFMWSLCVIR
jgi:flagellar basal body-associated protein FliL